ncbi:MAG: BA14K family protein [Bauldia sp.]|nr:MAG: BA14K family protein [Bauldia sp.]
MSKLVAAALSGLIAAAAMTAAPAVATADWRGPPKYGYGPGYGQGYGQGYRQGYRKGGGNAGWGPGFATGAILGLGLGVIATTPRPAPYYAPGYYAPDYYTPQPYYYTPPPPPPPVYYPRSWTEAHVEWCITRYRSYNPATNTFTGYDGYQHECVGPY